MKIQFVPIGNGEMNVFIDGNLIGIAGIPTMQSHPNANVKKLISTVDVKTVKNTED